MASIWCVGEGRGGMKKEILGSSYGKTMIKLAQLLGLEAVPKVHLSHSSCAVHRASVRLWEKIEV